MIPHKLSLENRDGFLGLAKIADNKFYLVLTSRTHFCDETLPSIDGCKIEITREVYEHFLDVHKDKYTL